MFSNRSCSRIHQIQAKRSCLTSFLKQQGRDLWLFRVPLDVLGSYKDWCRTQFVKFITKDEFSIKIKASCQLLQRPHAWMSMFVYYYLVKTTKSTITNFTNYKFTKFKKDRRYQMSKFEGSC